MIINNNINVTKLSCFRISICKPTQTTMKILKTPITANHKSAMFFDGIIAIGNDSVLTTYQTGEIVYNGKTYVGKEIQSLIGILNDTDIEDEITIEILVDKFFTIEYKGVVLEDIVFDNYDEAIKGFETFLNNL